MDKLEKLNRLEAMVTPRLHAGGLVTPAGEDASFRRELADVGSALTPRFHAGGAVLSAAPMPAIKHLTVAMSPLRFHDGGSVAVLPQRWPRLGLQSVADMNTVGTIPANALISDGARGSEGGNVYITQNFPAVTDYNSFRRSQPQMLADLARAVKKGMKHL
ncbi:MAG TPA: hypothetical protein VGK77_22285 [Candidatus Binatia bacterium]|jgi:hypothetical protein